MKKFIKLMVMMFILSMFMFGCGKQVKDTTVKGKDPQQDVNVEDNLAEDETAADEGATDVANIAIKGQELFSFNGLTITAKDVTYDKLLTEGIEVIIENNSNEEYTIQCDEVDFNDYTYGASFMETVSAGETLDSRISVYGAEEFFAPEEIAKVSLYFRVKDSAYSLIFNSGEIILKTTQADKIEILKPEGGDVIYEGDNIRITSLGLVLDDYHTWHIKLFIENNRDELIDINCGKALVNGNEIETLCYKDVSPNKMSLSFLTFNSEMKSYEFEDIEDIIISFKITNVNTYELIDNTDIISVPVVMAE